ncbi:hypothetical protein H5P28_16565 [Ruficoccus amylovorans]|uniref:Glycoside hydrolase family 5 domain-containing protein n=1 Tax=Ruficoccus amylovorans TaxID=1804625 RepID=A0A842HHS5_9BACT|nr:hypothetical protein [Ruficoccus amylovorans]MBC2595879.1 hypothetical protein [Ruficoccus amylovorans]
MKKKKLLLPLCILSTVTVWNVATVGGEDKGGKEPSPTLIFEESEDYKAVDMSHPSVKAGSALDLSGLVDAPAGQYGRLTVNEQGKFAFETDPTAFRLFGYNKIPEGIWRDVSDEEFEQNAINYAQAARAQGYNMVRLHGIDLWLMRDTSADLEFNPQILDRFDRIVAELKKQGIYVHYVVMSYLHYDVLNRENYWNRMDENYMHKLMFAIGRGDERERFSEGASRLLNHVNPYTGLAWKDDPAVAIVECFNEMYLGISEINSVAIDYPDEYRLFVNKWAEWLNKRYEGKTEAELPEWVSGIDLQNPPVPGVGGEYEAAKDDYGRFLYDCVVETNTWGQDTLRQIGYDGLVTNTYNGLYGAAAAWSSLPVADTHNYFEHPYGPSERRSVGQRSSINTPWCFPSIAASRLYGRPFTVSEYNYPFWNQFQYEMPLTFGAYAAFQGFDSLEVYEASVYLNLDNQRLGSFNVGVSPVQRGGEFLTAMLYKRGDVAPANNRVALLIPEEFLFTDGNSLKGVSSQQNKLSLMTGFSLIFPSLSPSVEISEDIYPDLILLPSGTTGIKSTGWSTEMLSDYVIENSALAETVDDLKWEGILPDNNLTDLDKGIYQSDTGEITLRRDAFEITVITPKTEAVAMLAGNNRKLGALTIKSTDTKGLFGVTAVDNCPLVESERLVLVVATEVVNTGMELTSDRITCLQLGTAPVLMKTVNFSIGLSHQAADQLRCFALRIDGERMQEIPLTVGDGHVTLEVDTAALADGPTPFFELTTD